MEALQILDRWRELDMLNDPEKMRSYIHKVHLSSRHLLSLINDILDMSRIESGGVVLNQETVSLAEQVGQIAAASGSPWICP